MPFELEKCPGRISHLNVRKEGPDDEKELAIDLKIQVTAPALVLRHLIGDDQNAAAFISGLWDEAGTLQVLSIASIGFDVTFENHVLRINGIVLEDARLLRFSFKPRDVFDVDLEFCAAVKPLREVVSVLAEYVQEDVLIAVEPAEQELPLEGARLRATEHQQALALVE